MDAVAPGVDRDRMADEAAAKWAAMKPGWLHGHAAKVGALGCLLAGTSASLSSPTAAADSTGSSACSRAGSATRTPGRTAGADGSAGIIVVSHRKSLSAQRDRTASEGIPGCQEFHPLVGLVSGRESLSGLPNTIRRRMASRRDTGRAPPLATLGDPTDGNCARSPRAAALPALFAQPPGTRSGSSESGSESGSEAPALGCSGARARALADSTA